MDPKVLIAGQAIRAAAPTVTMVGRPACSTVAWGRVSTRCSLTSWSLQPARETTHTGVSADQPAACSRRDKRAQLLARHVEDLAVGAARGAQFAVLCHRRAEGDASAAAAACQRPPRRGRRGQRSGDARHHLAFDALCGQRFELFFQPAEQARVAALETHHQRMPAGHAHEQRVDGGLSRGMREAALADVEPLRLRRQLAQRRVGEGVEQHHVGAGQHACAAQRDQVGRAGAGADEDDLSHQRTTLTSSAPLVRLLAGSTTISEPATRLCA